MPPNIDEHEYLIRLNWGDAVYILTTGKKRTALSRLVSDGKWTLAISKSEAKKLRQYALPVIAQYEEWQKRKRHANQRMLDTYS